MADTFLLQSLPEHGGQLRALAGQLRIPPSDLLDFSASIHPVPPPQHVLRALSGFVADPQNLIHYPDTRQSDLKNALAAYVGVPAASIVVGNGMMPLLQAVLNAVRSRRCLVLTPAFAGYERTLAACGTEFCSSLLAEKNNFKFDTKTVLSALENFGCDTLLLANPHSPSGVTVSRSSVAELAYAAADRGVTVIVDEAFIDYVPQESIVCETAHSPRIVALRTLTKFFAIPGLRVAYAMAHGDIAECIEKCMPLWPVDTIAAEAARLMLSESEFITQARFLIQQERRWLAEQLSALDWQVFPSSVNYLLVKTANGGASALWERLLTEHRIAIRVCANFEGLNESFFRVAVRTRRDNERLVSACANLKHAKQFFLQVSNDTN